MERKRYDSVADMVDDMCDPEFAKQFRQQLEDTRLVRLLTIMRVSAGLSAEELALHMGWSEDTVEYICDEDRDYDIKLADFDRWAKACGFDVGKLLLETIHATHDSRRQQDCPHENTKEDDREWACLDCGLSGVKGAIGPSGNQGEGQ